MAEAKHEGQLVRQHNHKPKLIVRISSDEGVKYVVKRVTQSEGRIIKCPSIYVSRTHCEIFRKDKAYWIRDLGSSNGTFLNGVRLTPNHERELRFNDMVGMGISHEPTDESISASDPQCFIFKFCKRETEFDVIDLEDEDTQVVTPAKADESHAKNKNKDSDEEITIVEEVPKAANQSSNSDSSSSPRKAMPPPPPPPRISDQCSSSPLSKSSRKTLPIPQSSTTEANANNLTSLSATSKDIPQNNRKPEDPNTSKSFEGNCVKSSEEKKSKRPLVTENDEQPVKRLKETRKCSTSSDDSSDGLGEVEVNIKAKPKGKSSKNSYSGPKSSDDSSSDENENTANNSKWMNISAGKQDTSVTNKVQSHLSKMILEHQQMLRKSEDRKILSRRKCDEMKVEALQKECKVSLHSIIVYKNSKYTLSKSTFNVTNPETRRRMQVQFRASLKRNGRDKSATSSIGSTSSISNQDGEPMSPPFPGNKEERVPGSSNKRSRSFEEGLDKSNSLGEYLNNDNNQDHEMEHENRHHDMEDVNRDHDIDDENRDYNINGDNNEEEEMQVDVPKSVETPDAERPRPERRGIQLLEDAPLPRFAARAQSKFAAFKSPKPTTSSSFQRVQSRAEESLVTSPTSPTYLSKDDQKQLRNQKLKELELKKQQEKEIFTPSPKPKAMPKVKCTSRNRNQGLMDTILGADQNESTNAAPVKSSPVENVKEPKPQEKAPIGLSDPRLHGSNSRVVPRDPNLKKNITIGSRPLPFLQQSSKDPVAVAPPSFTTNSKPGPSILKPGAEVILSPPPANNIPYKEKSKPAGSKPINTQPYYPEDDIYKRILSWRPIWLQEQKDQNSKTDPPILNKELESLTMTLTRYDTYEAYVKIYYPLLLSELWACIGSDLANKSRDIQSKSARTEYSVKIDSVKRDRVFPFSKQKKTHETDKRFEDDHWVFVTCHTWVRHKGEIDYRKDLVVLTLKGSQKNTGEKSLKEVFGFPCPSTERYDPITKKLDCDPRLWKGKFSRDSGYRYTETYVCKFGSNFEVNKAELGKVDRIASITQKIREFKALNTLKSFALWHKIVFPSKDPKDSWEEWKKHNMQTKSPDMISVCRQLNVEQQAIVKRVCNKISSPEPELMLMHGPPGTGKTRTVVALVLQLLVTYQKRFPGRNHRVLICTPSNAAVDEIMRRLIQSTDDLPTTFSGGKKISIVRVGEGYARELYKYTVDAKVEQMDAEESTAKSIKAEIAAYDFDIIETEKQIEDLKKENNTIGVDSKLRQLQALRDTIKDLKKDYDNIMNKNKSSKEVAQQKRFFVIKNAQIICSTLSSSSTSLMKGAFASIAKSEEKPFICCIVDEASQTTEPETLLPVVLNIDKLVLVGDPHQLGATVLSNSAEEKQYGRSLFTRHFQFQSRSNRSHSSVMMLVRQYRMHPEIVKWPNNYFYDGQLKDIYTDPGNSYPLRPYYFLNVQSGREVSDKGQIQNDDEVVIVKAVVDVIDEILHPSNTKWTLGIITPYAAQKQSIRQEFQDKTFKCFDNLDIDTVDGFQGQEKDIIILSCVRTKEHGFLKSRNRLNVALTRAKHSLYIIGDGRCLCQEDMWKCLIQDAAKCNNKYDVHSNFRADIKLLQNQLQNNLKMKRN